MTILPIHIFYDLDHHFQLYDIKKLSRNLKYIRKTKKWRRKIKEFSNRLKNENKDLFKELEKKFTNESKVEDNFLENYTTLYRYMDSCVCDEKDQRDFSYLNIFTDYSLNLEILHNISTDFIKDDYKANINSKNISIVDTSYTLRSILNWMKKAIKKYNNSINISNGFNDTQNYIKYVIFSSQGSSIGTLDSFMHYFFNISIDDIDFSESRYFELYIDNETEQINVRYLKGDNKIKMNTTYKIFKNIVEKNIGIIQKFMNFAFLMKMKIKRQNMI